LERLGLTLEQADGVAFTFWSDDADSDGNPDDLLADGIVTRHEMLGWIARIDPTSFRHRSENRQQKRTDY